MADEHRIGVAQGVDERVIEGLRANFVGECTEVGMYLAMSRQADREGYPRSCRSLQENSYSKKQNMLQNLLNY